MKQNVHQSGVKLLNALSRHADIIMQGYVAGQVDETSASPKVLDSLLSMGILWRAQDDEPLRLKNAVRQLLETGLHDERNRHIDANIGSAITSLKTIAQHYKEALQHQRFSEAQSHLSDLTEHVYSVTESLANSVRVLFSRINNEFGYVSSLDAKIRENQLAQSQVSALLNQLEMFQFDELSDIAASHRELRHLLVVTLQSSFSRVTQELSIVQAQLLALLGRFREFKGRTRLLKGFLLHLENTPDFAPVNYCQLSSIPQLFNQAPGIIKSAHADVHRIEHEKILHQMVGSIRTLNRQHNQVAPERSSRAINVEAQTAVGMEEDALKREVDAYFCNVIDAGAPLTALEYYQQQQLSFDPEAWIYEVIGGYQGLTVEEQAYFAIEQTGEVHPDFSGNFIIRDVELGLR